MRYFTFCQDALVLERTGDGYRIPEAAPTEIKPWTTVMNVDGDKAYRIDQPLTGSDRYEMCPLRQSYYKLPEQDYLKAGKCHELLYWDQNTRFCGCCGGAMRFDTDISKKCEQCGKEVWPQLAIAIIVLIRKEDQVLLVRARNFRHDFYGLVAGFVETGETLEEAVHREVMEETGLSVTETKYLFTLPNDYEYSGLPIPTMDVFFVCRVDDFVPLHADDDAAECVFIKKDELNPDDFGLKSIRRAMKMIKENPAILWQD